MSDPPFSAALRSDPRGLHIDLDVTPGARDDRFPTTFDPWRKRIGCRVRAPAQAGKANAAVCATVAAFFDTAAGTVAVVTGPTSTRKTVHVAGLGRPAAITRLAEVLP